MRIPFSVLAIAILAHSGQVAIAQGGDGGVSLSTLETQASGEAIGKYNANHVSSVNPSSAFAIGEVTYELWRTTVGVDTVVFSWDPKFAEILISVNGDAVEDVIMFRDSQLRPAFVGMWGDNGYRINGFVDVDDSGTQGILQVGLDSEFTRVFGDLEIDRDNGGNFLVVATSTCVCFGAPGGGRSCSDDECDTGVSCGTANNGTNKACRWKAGTIIAR